MGLCENCSTLKILKTFLVVCLSLVLIQYLINLVTYKYVTKAIKGTMFGTNRSAFGFIFPDWNYLEQSESGDFQTLKTVKTDTSGIANSSDIVRTTVIVQSTVRPAVTSNATTLNSTIMTVNSSSLSGELCPLVPPKLVGALATFKAVLSFDEISKRYPELKPGGRFKPPNCTARHRVAIVVPYRAREDQLKILLNNLHPILERQQLDYAIYIVEQALPSTFNRALLMNVGYVEALKDYDFQCFIFHDVDLIPENDKNLYTCPEKPRHMSVAIDKFNYKLPYGGLFGGVSALTKEHMVKVNGFSNKYFGWGGEDDDMMTRIKHNGLKLSRAPIELARYRMIKHGRDKTNDVNKHRFKLLYSATKRMKTDGLNSLKYEVLKKEYRPLYTWVYTKVNSKDY